MTYPAAFIVLIAHCLVFPSALDAQGESAVPFLLISSSPEGNGMGGTAATQPTRDALATISNPAQLGIFTLNNMVGASTYTPRTNWLPQFNISGLTYGTTAINAGYNLRDLLSLPFSLSAGIGYSRVHIDLGTFTVTSSSGPAPIATYSSNETSESICTAIGLEYYVRFGIAMSFKRIESNLSSVGTEQEQGGGSARSSATDFGLLFDVPLARIVADLAKTSFDIAPKTSPFLDLSFGYVKANVGSEMVYIEGSQADPLPRTAILGLGAEFGLTSNAGPSEWKLASFRVAHQADDLLVVRNPDGSSDYQSGLGDIQFVDNVILGKANSKATVRKGWQVQVAEFLYLRGGSVEGPGLAYSTSGYSICLGGVLHLLALVSPSLGKDSWVGFLGEHFDLQYHSSKYDETTSPIGGTTSAALNLVVKGFALQ
jgi:hypothetical protein